MADKAFITPKVLKWARESAKISEEAAAGKVSVSIERLQEWENGISQPTIRQAQALAKAYKRPFALLFLPEIPRDFQPLQDYRKADAKPLSTASIFIIREIQQKQAWIREINEENGEDKLPFVGKYSLSDKPEIVAADILNTLDIDPLKYKSDTPIKEWIDKVEAKGVFISRTSFIHSKLKLDSEEIQGFAISDPFAPFIFINSDDWQSAQLFTLVHELAHIWIAETGLSNEIEIALDDKDKFHPVELFCNAVAANALMPANFMKVLETDVFKESRALFKISKSIGVSSFAFLYRALNLNLIDVNTYKRLKKEADWEFKLFLKREEEKKARKKERDGGPNPYLLRLNKNSKLFTQIVLDSFRNGIVEPTQASFLLNTPVNKFSSLESQLYS
jgi:Zn-dependent peptidase ImmA (M78 family)/DNA-binding XRE family transcriptional regulator